MYMMIRRIEMKVTQMLKMMRKRKRTPRKISSMSQAMMKILKRMNHQPWMLIQRSAGARRARTTSNASSSN
jgi:hypothetical protein